MAFLTDKIRNEVLKCKFNCIPDLCRKEYFNNRKLIFEDYFNDLNNWNVADGVPYSNTEVWLIKEALHLIDDGLMITCWKQYGQHTLSDGSIFTSRWISGRIDTRHKHEFSNGVWVIRAKAVDSFFAAWLLKNDRQEPGYQRSQIIPEVDIAENIDGKVRHTVHYGYQEEPKYTRTSIGSSIFKADDEFHDFAVEMLADGFRFYVDGIETAAFRNKYPEFVTNFPSYLILNNASKDGFESSITYFIIQSVKFYQ